MTLAIAALAVEGILRIAKVNTLSNIMVVPGKGVTRVPHGSYVWKKEGYSEGRFNSHGFRDSERRLEKPPGVFRIAVFGDSYTDALSVGLEKTFPALLERRLNESGRGRFEVLNLGQSGFGTADEYNRWIHFGLDYSPDLVLVAFYPGNDIRNNSPKLNLEDLACYLVRAPSGESHLDCSAVARYLAARGPLKRAWQTLKRHSYFASFLSERSFLLRRQLAADARRASTPQAAPAAAAELDPFADGNVYLDDPPAQWAEAYSTTEDVLSRFAQDVRNHGEQFALVTISTPEQIDPRASSAMRAVSAAPLDFDRPERVVAEYAEAQGIPALRLGPIFRASFSSAQRTLHGFDSVNHGHWNERGHQLAADSIFEFLVGRNLVPRPSSER